MKNYLPAMLLSLFTCGCNANTIPDNKVEVEVEYKLPNSEVVLHKTILVDKPETLATDNTIQGWTLKAKGNREVYFCNGGVGGVGVVYAVNQGGSSESSYPLIKSAKGFTPTEITYYICEVSTGKIINAN